MFFRNSKRNRLSFNRRKCVRFDFQTLRAPDVRVTTNLTRRYTCSVPIHLGTPLLTTPEVTESVLVVYILYIYSGRSRRGRDRLDDWRSHPLRFQMEMGESQGPTHTLNLINLSDSTLFVCLNSNTLCPRLYSFTSDFLSCFECFFLSDTSFSLI